MSLSFAALDVETANGHRGSICSFGIVIVRDGLIVGKQHLLTQPPHGLDWFAPFNTALHGITAADVAGAPSFSVQLARVLDLVGDLPVIAHNAAFEIGAIREGCDAQQLDWPTLTYVCSLVLSRRAGLGLLSYRLPLVCAALEVPVGVHHRADDDAEAAARIVLALAARQSVSSLQDLAVALMARLGHLTPAAWAGCIAMQLVAGQRSAANLDADPNHPLYGKTVAFTGALSSTRAEVAALVAGLGATPQPAPTMATDYLVIGDGFTGTSPSDFHTGKAAKAVKINAKGGHIEVLTEGDLLDLLAESVTAGVRTLQPT
jgi:DNA polymerase-3 subunit epsilon